MAETMVIASRYCGPPKSGNGGYVCGRVAAFIDGAASVRLKAAPPLETEMRVETADGTTRLVHGATVVAEGRATALDVTLPPPPSFAQAEEAAKSCPGFARHPFPRCFVCGPHRLAGDGMRIFPGPIDGKVAAPWVPDASLAGESGRVLPEFLWAALDCTSGFAVLPVADGQAIVLGELAARIDGSVSPDEECVVLGWPIGTDGRKRIAGSALLAASGRPLAIARATWIEVPASAFGG
jgi:hypothetical protein